VQKGGARRIGRSRQQRGRRCVVPKSRLNGQKGNDKLKSDQGKEQSREEEARNAGSFLQKGLGVSKEKRPLTGRREEKAYGLKRELMKRQGGEKKMEREEFGGRLPAG